VPDTHDYHKYERKSNRDPSTFMKLDKRSREVEYFNCAKEKQETNGKEDTLVPAKHNNE